MRHGKYQKTCRRTSPVIWIVLVLVLLSLSFGGVMAYLSISGGTVTNTFEADLNPVITVDDAYTVTVEADYAVYLRAAVVPNWVSNSSGTILAAVPVEGKNQDYQVGSDWELLNDGFYYYTRPVTDKTPTSAIVTPGSNTKDGYTLRIDVAVQAIQAIGTTDGNSPIEAVKDAWGITGEQIKN